MTIQEYPTGRLLSERKAAALAGCPSRRIAQAYELGEGPVCFLFGTRRYYRREDVLSWIAGRRVNPAATAAKTAAQPVPAT